MKRRCFAVSVTFLMLMGILNGIGHIGTNAYMFRGNLHRTGVYDSTVPESNSLLWSFDTGTFMESSPVVVDDKVYYGCENGEVYCLYASNGTEKWNFTTGNPVKSTPSVVDGVVYVGSADRTLYALNAENKSLLWSYLAGGQIVSSPAVANGKIFFGTDDDNLTAINAATHELEWKFQTGDEIWSSPAVDWPYVYVGSLDGRVYSIWADNGTEKWNYTIGQSVYSSPVVHNGKVFVGSSGYPSTYDGAMLALDNYTGELIWRFNTTGYVYSSPAVHDGKVFFGTAPDSGDSFLYALPENDSPPGDGIINQTEVLWKKKTFDYSEGGSSPAVADGKVLIGSRGGNRLFCFNETTGDELWNLTTGAGIIASPAVANGVVYIASSDGTVYAISGIGTGILDIQIIPEFPTIKSNRVMGISFLVTYGDEPIEGAFINVDVSDGTLSQSGASTFPDGTQRIKYTAPIVEENTTITVHARATKFGYTDGESTSQFIVERPSSYEKVSSGSMFSLSKYWVYIVVIAALIAVNVVIVFLSAKKGNNEINNAKMAEEDRD